jgi:hypothetical protein
MSGSTNMRPTGPAVKAKLLEGKKGLIVGIANENSIVEVLRETSRFERVRGGPGRIRTSNQFVMPIPPSAGSREGRSAI